MGKELDLINKEKNLNGNIGDRINDVLKAETGLDLKELIESGRLLDEHGKSFVTEDRKLSNGRSNFYSDAEEDAINAIRYGKALLIADENQKAFPCWVTCSTEKAINAQTHNSMDYKRITMSMGNPLSDIELDYMARDSKKAYLKTVQEDHPDFYEKDGIKKPGWINQQVDKLLRWLTGTGTEAMETYRTLSAGLEDAGGIGKRITERKTAASEALKEKWQNEKIAAHEKDRKAELKNAELRLSDEVLLNYGAQRGKPISEKDKKLAEEFRTTLLGKAEKDWRVRALIIDMSKTFEQKTRNYAFEQLLKDDEVTPMRKMFQSFRENGTSDLEKYKKELGEQIEAAANKIGKPVISTNQPAPTGKITNLQQDLEKGALDV